MLNIPNLNLPLQEKINRNINDFNEPSQILKKYANYPEVEVEARLIRDDINLEMYKKIQDFMTTMSENIKLIKETKSLDIYLTTSNKVNQSDQLSNLRFTLQDGQITEYCKNDQLPSNFSLLYKSPLYWNKKYNETDTINIENSHIYDKNISSSHIDLHDIRLNAKLELEYDNTKGVFNEPVLSSEFIKHHMNLANNKVSFFKTQNFATLYKNYRLKHRHRYLFSFNNDNTSSVDNFYIDMTKVRSSKRVMNETVAVLNFVDSEIAEQNEYYEIEFEFIKTSENKLQNTIHTIIYPFINRLILPYCFGSPISYVYSHKEAELVRNEYTRELNDAFKVIINYKLDIIKLLMTKTSKNDIMKLYRIKGYDDINDDIKDELRKINNNMKYRYTFYDEYPELEKYSYFTRVLDYLRVYAMRGENNYKNELKQLELDYTKKLAGNLYKNNSGYTFISPKVMTMEMNDIRYENIKSVQYDYTVTDKADGQGMLLINLKDGDSWMRSLHLMDSNLNIYPTDKYLKDGIRDTFCLLNGEYIGHKNDKMYGIFDLYMLNNISYLNAPLMITEENDEGVSRLSKAKQFLDMIQNLNDNTNKFRIFLKKFNMVSDNMTIWKAGYDIWEQYQKNEGYSYHLDGLIYTPMYEPVAYDMGYKDSDLKLSRTWKRNLKWKPARETTIDFLIKFDKMSVATYNNREVYKDVVIKKSILSEGGGQIIKEYKVAYLYVSGSINENEALKPLLFNPEEPTELNAHIIHLPLEWDDNSKKFQVFSEDMDGNKRVIEDNTIVEMSYNNDYNVAYVNRWIPLRTRYDKTFDYKRGLTEQKRIFELLKYNLQRNTYKLEDIKDILQGIYIENMNMSNIKDVKDVFNKYKNYISKKYTKSEDLKVDINFGNNIHVANSLWKTIHNPIKEEYILEGKNIPEISSDDDYYYNRDQYKKRETSVTYSLQRFHNYIKSHILLENAAKYCQMKFNYINLLDMTCGMGGDIRKWVDNKVNRCLGIDLFASNIKNAKERYMQYKNDNQGNVITEMNFIVGDSSKRIKTDINNAIPNKEDREIYNNLMKEYYEREPFNIITLMFSLHYFFKDENTLDNMIRNIDDHLANGGLLIGACFDGNMILNEINKKLDDLYVYKDGVIIMKIVPEFLEKKQGMIELPNNENTLGLDIDVYVYSINKLIKEYLVNFKYLSKKLEKYEIYELDDSMMGGMILPVDDNNKKVSIGSFERVYDLMKKIVNKEILVNEKVIKSAESIIDMLSEEEFSISKLNKYFMYVKRKKVEVKAKMKKVIDDEFEKYKKEYSELLEEIEKVKTDKKKLKMKLSKLLSLVKNNINNANPNIVKYTNEVVMKMSLQWSEYYKSLK
jgi:hypothetical protein